MPVRADHLQSSTRSRPSRPSRPEQTDLARTSRFSDRYLQLQHRAGQGTTPFGTVPGYRSCPLPGLLSPQPPTAHLRFAFLCLPFPTPTRSSSCPVEFRLPSLSPSLALEPALFAASARRVWRRQETLSPSQSVPVTSVNDLYLHLHLPRLDIRRYLSSTCSWRRGPISCSCLRLVLGLRHFITEGTSSHHRVPAASSREAPPPASTSPGPGFRPRSRAGSDCQPSRLHRACVVYLGRLVVSALANSHYLTHTSHSPRSPPLNHCRRRQPVLPSDPRLAISTWVGFLALGFPPSIRPDPNRLCNTITCGFMPVCVPSLASTLI